LLRFFVPWERVWGLVNTIRGENQAAPVAATKDVVDL
jgi:hypothetical protein